MSGNFYTGNAIYQAIEESRFRDDFRWRTRNSWLLIYGDGQSNPKVLVYVEAVRGDPQSTRPSASQPVYLGILSELAGPMGLPMYTIRYDATSSSITEVGLSRDLNGERKVDLEDLASAFESLGLRVSNRHVKRINVASSSPYHDWQREALGGLITVSDIDLIRVRDESPTELVETNRSYYALDDWRPWPRDFPKFRLVWRVASSNELPMTIVYNYRRKEPFFDDPSRVSIFSMDFGRQGNPWEWLGAFQLDYFLRGRYMD